MASSELRRLPSVDTLVRRLAAGGDPARRHLAVEAAREVLARLREEVVAGAPLPTEDQIVALAGEQLETMVRPSLRRVINASGVILQTNLGRAPLSERAIRAMQEVAAGYSNLEYDLGEGTRGSRHGHVRDLIHRATGAEDGLAVNNNASALLMVLAVFAAGRGVIVSRGEAVEIGGGFRIPDVMRESGATLVEVGTTNRTYARDYAQAITPETAMLLKVHASNFRVVGFTASPTLTEIASIARRNDLMMVEDLGSGCLLDTRAYGLAEEPTVQQSLAAGADLTLFSGDKLLGGPQCGLIVGRHEYVEVLRRHPLARALRVDKLTIAALNATLLSYVEGRAAEEIPVWRMVAAPGDGLKRRARRWARAADSAGSVEACRSMVGGGSLPGEGVPGWCAAIRHPSGPDALARMFREARMPVIGHIADDAVMLDPRTVGPQDDRYVERLIGGALSQP